MKNSHYSDLTAELLQTLVVVYEERSIVKAAARMEQNPSTLSHRIERLRQILGNDLFVRAGRGIVPTPFAEEAIADARGALDSIHSMGERQNFDPKRLDEELTIATTDIERSTFILDAYKSILEQAPNLKLRFVWEKYTNSKALRGRDVDFIISPIVDSADSDIRQRVLYRDKAVCYFDAAYGSSLDTLDNYLQANHVRVMFSETDISLTDVALHMIGETRKIAVTMPSVSELPTLMAGTNLVTTMPSRLRKTVLKGFDYCQPPFKINNMAFKLFWHESTHNSPKHSWLRQQFFDYVDQRPELKNMPVFE